MSVFRQLALPLALFSILWVDLCRQLSYTWDTNEQYAYGWFVPLLALGLFIRRWPTRPSPQPTAFQGFSVPVSALTASPISAFQRFSISAFVFLLCLLLLPLRVIIEINPDWPLITWPYTLIVVALTLYAIHLAGPRSSPREMSGPAISPGSAFRRFISVFNFLNFRFSPRPPSSVVGGPSPESPNPISAFYFHNFRFFKLSPWVAHFAFPVCFILVAVQWPYRIEHGLTQNLMQIVASLTVEIIGWCGIPAIQQGNLIELSTGVLGVDEACSGIRSFQSTLMAALFLGELYLLRVPIRLLLVVAGLGAAFLLNVCRTLILTWQANAHGLSAIDKWHDPAGFTIAIACFGVLWLLAILIKKRWPVPDPQPSSSDIDPSSSAREMATRPAESVRYSTGSPISPGQLSAFPISALCFHPCRHYLLIISCWVVFVVLGNQIWYGMHARKVDASLRWSAMLPSKKSTYKELTLTPKELAALKCDTRQGGSWREADDTQWAVWFFRWDSQSLLSLVAARCHRPEVCLPASGRKMKADHGLRWYKAGDLSLPFRTYEFDNGDQPLYVFFCLWQDGTEQLPVKDNLALAGRLWAAFNGRRALGQQSLEIIISGDSSFDAAEQAVRERLPGLIRIEPPAPLRQSAVNSR